MNKEIKEILDLMKFANDDIMWCDTLTLNAEQSHLLLDYIANLQEENKRLKAELELYKENCDYLNDKIDDAIEFIDRYLRLNLEAFDAETLLKKLESLLQGEDNE